MSNIANLHDYYDEDEKRNYLLVPEDEYEVANKSHKEQQREYFARQKAIESDTRYYVNCYHDAILELNEKLDVNELGAIMKLIPYLKMDSGGQLVYRSKRMGITEIRKAIGKGDRWTRDIVKVLTDAGVLEADKDGRRNVYNVVERYHTIGHTLKDRYYTKLYQTKTKTDIKDITVQAAGVLYKMLPFFHYEKYYLCANPNERNPEKLHHLTQAELSRLTNVSQDVINRGVRELRKYGFMMMQDAYGAQVMMINPDIMYRKKEADDYTDTVRYQFKQAKANADEGGNCEWLPY